MADQLRGTASDMVALGDMIERVGLAELLYMISQLADDYSAVDLRQVKDTA